jgi:hypothetical protein
MYFVLITTLFVVSFQNASCEILSNEDDSFIEQDEQKKDEILIEYKTVFVGNDNQIRVIEGDLIFCFNRSNYLIY